MNTTNLATFVAVMQTGSISSAAEKLYITQPAVSKRIKNLEDEFGTALFDTVGRSIIPTAALVNQTAWAYVHEPVLVNQAA